MSKDVPDFWSSLNLRVSVTVLASLETTSCACSMTEGFCSDIVREKNEERKGRMRNKEVVLSSI